MSQWFSSSLENCIIINPPAIYYETLVTYQCCITKRNVLGSHKEVNATVVQWFQRWHIQFFAVEIHWLLFNEMRVSLPIGTIVNSLQAFVPNNYRWVLLNGFIYWKTLNVNPVTVMIMICIWKMYIMEFSSLIFRLFA